MLHLKPQRSLQSNDNKRLYIIIESKVSSSGSETQTSVTFYCSLLDHRVAEEIERDEVKVKQYYEPEWR